MAGRVLDEPEVAGNQEVDSGIEQVTHITRGGHEFEHGRPNALDSDATAGGPSRARIGGDRERGFGKELRCFRRRIANADNEGSSVGGNNRINPHGFQELGMMLPGGEDLRCP